MTFTDALEMVKIIPELEKIAGELKPYHEIAEEYSKVASEEDFEREILREQAHAKIAGVCEENIRFQRVAVAAHEYEKVAAELERAYKCKESLTSFEEEHGDGAVHKEIIKEAEEQEAFSKMPIKEACEVLEKTITDNRNEAFADTVSYINTAEPEEILEVL